MFRGENVALFMAVIVCVCYPLGIAGEMYRNEELSLDETPYNDGRLYEMWSMSGSTTVSEDFIRLTPELQSQHGSVDTQCRIG